MIKKILSKPSHKLRIARQYPFYKTIRKFFEGKQGIEIGGPSSIFSFELPVYRVASGIDGCNFSHQTVWEGSLREGLHYKYRKNKAGYQFICEGTDLHPVESNKYDFLLASHCLEHIANPVKAVREWLRVVKPGGTLLLVLPYKEVTFDHRRSVTSFEHLKQDFEAGIDEADLTHLEEILQLHDLARDPGAGDAAHFRQRSLENFRYRCLHHHVFDFALLNNIFSFLNIQKLTERFIPPCHQLIIGIKK